MCRRQNWNHTGLVVSKHYSMTSQRKSMKVKQLDLGSLILRTTQLNGDINTLMPRQNGRRFADNTFKCNFLNENVWIPIKISLKLVPKGPIDNIPALVQIMAWRSPGDKPLSAPMLVSLPTHKCVTRPQWVKPLNRFRDDINSMWDYKAVWLHAGESL